MNPAGLCMMGVTHESEVVGTPYLGAVSEADRDRISDLLRQAKDGVRSEFEFVAVNGRAFLSLFEPIHGDDGQVARLMGLTQDVTERRALEQRFRQSQRLECIGQLAGGIAHDFNNMLMVIFGNLELAKVALTKGKDATYALEEIQNAAEQAAGLTEGLLAVGRRQSPSFAALDLNQLLDEQVRMLGRVLAESIRLDLDLAEGLPTVWADAGQIKQIVLNLCINASQAMRSGGTLRIRTGVDSDSGRGWFEVSDTGCGMSEEVQELAFDPFFTTKAHGEGTGLGLSTVYGIVKQHGGQVQISSVEGEGTKVTVEIPLGTGDRVETRKEPTLVKSGVGSERILLVEDEKLVRDLLAAILTGAGYTVLTAEDGVEALAVFSANEGIDLVLSDLVMPRLDGRGVLEGVAKMGGRVMLMTGYSTDALNPEEFEAQGVRLLRKPFRPDALLLAIREALDAEKPA